MPEPRSIGPVKPHAQRIFRGHHADADGTLLPDAVVGQQGLVFVDVAVEAAGKAFDEVEHRTLADFVQLVHGALAAHQRRFVLRHRVRQIAVHAARTVVGRVHARARDRFVHVEQVFAVAEGVQEGAHRADVECVRAQPHQVVQDARDLVEHGADVLRADRHVDAEQALDGQYVTVLVAHHRDVVEAVHVRHRLKVGAGLGQLFGAAVQQADVRVGALDDLAVQLQHQAQHAVRCRVLRTEVQGVILKLSHYFIP
jgi:hypothetical protein